MANQNARALRKAMTQQEVKLWIHLRSWRTRGFHFRRQVPRDGYILDFVCLRQRLIVEVDGGQHGIGDRVERDRLRDEHFERKGFNVLRFWNSDVNANLSGVLEAVDNVLRDSSPTRSASPTSLPLSGEG